MAPLSYATYTKIVQVQNLGSDPGPEGHPAKRLPPGFPSRSGGAMVGPSELAFNRGIMPIFESNKRCPR